MPDEIDARLLRSFAESHANLSGAEFTARVAALLPARGWRTMSLYVVGASLARGIAAAVRAPLRVRHAGLMALAAAAYTLWAALQG